MDIKLLSHKKDFDIVGSTISIKLIKTDDIKVKSHNNFDAFVKLFLTKKEIQKLFSCTNVFNFVAKCLAAKTAFIEAIRKESKLSYLDIEMSHDALGRPILRTEKYNGNIHLSISDEDQHVVAVVLIESHFS